MNIFENPKIRNSVLLLLGLLQVASVTIIREPFSNQLFLVLHGLYLILGFLSMGWKQAVRNISWVTLPVVVFIALILSVIAWMNGNLSQFHQSLVISISLWGLALVVGLPLFLLGFGARCVALKLK